MKSKFSVTEKTSVLSQFLDISQKFYTDELYKVIKRYQVSNIEGIFFLFIKNFWFIFIGLLSQRFSKLSSTDSNLHFLSDSNSFLEFFRKNTSVDIIITFLFIVNAFIFIIYSSIYINYLITMTKKSSRRILSNDDQDIEVGSQVSKRLQSTSSYYLNEVALMNRYHNLKQGFSFIIAFNYHVLFVPSLYFPILNSSNPLSILTVIIAVCLGLVYCDCDYNYLVKNKDYLAKAFNVWQYLILAIEILCAIVLEVNDSVNFILLICLFAIKTIYYYLINPYLNEITQKLSVFLSIYFTLTSLLLMFCTGYNTLNGMSAFMIFFFVPFSWKAADLLYNLQDEHIKSLFQALSLPETVVDVNAINFILRKQYLFTELFNANQNNQRKIDFFNLISKATSSQFEELFSYDNQSESKPTQSNNNTSRKYSGNVPVSVNVSAEEMKEQNELFAKVKMIIQKYMERIIFGSKSLNTEFIFAYLVFLLEIKESQKLYLLSYLVWSSKTKINKSAKYIQIIQSIHQKFEENKLILKSTLGHTNPFYEGFMDVIVFEQKVEQAYLLLDKCISLKVEILNMMQQKLIVLQMMMEQIETVQFLLGHLKNLLSFLALMNEDNIELVQLQIYYLQCLSFNESDISIGQLNQYKKAYLSEVRDMFSKDSCVAFVQHDISTNQSYFKRVSQNFERIFYIKPNDIVGKKIDTLIPSNIQNVHSAYIKEFLDEESSRLDQLFNSIIENGEQFSIKSNKKEKQLSGGYGYKMSNGESFKSICKMGDKIIFALSGERHIVPVNIDLRVNSLSSDEFGFTIKVKKVKSPFDYILYDSTNFEVIGLSKNINESLFPDTHLSKINLATLFPFLQQKIENHTQQGVDTDYFESERSTQKVNQRNGGGGVVREVYYNQQSGKNQPSSNSKRTGYNIQFKNYIHSKNLNRRVFDFIVILDSTKNKRKTMTTFNSTAMTKESVVSKMTVERDTMYIFMEVKVFETGYKKVQNLNYLQISKVKMMNPFEQSQIIIAQIRDNIDLYLMSFPQSTLDRLILDLEKKSKQQMLSTSAYQQSPHQPGMYEENLSNSPKEQQLNLINNKLPSLNLINSINSQEQIQLQKEGPLQNKKGVEKDSAETFNEIIEEEQSISNKSENRQDEEAVKLGYGPQNLQAASQIYNQSMLELSQQQGISNNQLPMLSPDSSYFQFKHQQNEISSQLVYGNNLHNEKSYFDQSHLNATGIPVDASTNEMILKQNFTKKYTATTTMTLNMNMSSKDQLQDDHKASLQQQSTIDTKLFSPRVLSTHNFPLDSGKNMLSPTRLLYSQAQQKFYSEDGNIASDNKKMDLKDENRDEDEEGIVKKRKRKNKYNYDGRDTEEPDHGDHRMHANDWKAFKLKAEKGLNKYQQDDRRRVHDLQIEIASTTNSKQSSSASAKRQLAKILSTNQKIPSMKIIQFIGLICFVTLTSVTIWQYFTVIGSLTSSQLDLEAYDWPSQFRSMLYNMVKYTNLNYLMQFNDFTFESASQKAAYKKNVTNNLRYSKKIIIAHLADLESSNPDRLIFQKLRSETFDFLVPLYYDKSILSTTTSVVASQPGYVGATVNMSIQYAAIVFNQFCFWQSNGVGGRPEYFTILNQLNMITAIKTSENSIVAVQQSEDDKINQQLNTLLIIIFSVSACCIGVILPLYSYIQMKKDTIVTLLSTFTNDKLSSLINNIYVNYYNNKSTSSKFLKSVPNDGNLRRDIEQSRKQNLSQTTRLPRINKPLCFFVILIYLFIVCYPIIIKFVTQAYLKQASSNLNLTIQTNSIKAYLNEVISINYHALVLKLYPAVKPMQLSWYLDYINTLNTLIPSYEGDVTSLTDDRYTLSRYDQSSYDNVFYPLISSDICDTLAKHSSYITNTTAFNVYECGNINNGFLKKGFQLSFKEYLSTIEGITEIYTISNTTAQYKDATKNLFNSVNLKTLTDFSEYLEQTLDVMRQFVLNANTEYYNFILQVQLALIIYQVIVMVFIFIIGWYIFCQEMNNQINKTKRYLQIIDINSLIDNSYIITFIKSNINL